MYNRLFNTVLKKKQRTTYVVFVGICIYFIVLLCFEKTKIYV